MEERKDGFLKAMNIYLVLEELTVSKFEENQDEIELMLDWRDRRSAKELIG